jgi:hypothetical protein
MEGVNPDVADVRFGSKADMTFLAGQQCHVRFAPES